MVNIMSKHKQVEPSEDPRINGLLEQYTIRRSKVEDYIGEMEVLKDKVSSMFPDRVDHRSRVYLEEKIKASASFFQTLLSLTQEYNKSIVTEIDILRKLAVRSDGKERDVREIVGLLEKNNPELVNKLTETSKPAVEQIIAYDDESPESEVLLTESKEH